MTFVNPIGILVGVLAAYLVNALWFGPKTFYPLWMEALKKPIPTVEERDTSAKNALKLFGGTFAGQLAQGVVLAIIISVAKTADGTVGILTSAGIGLGVGVIAAGASLGHRLFAQHGFKAWAIEVGADILGLVVMGAIIGAF